MTMLRTRIAALAVGALALTGCGPTAATPAGAAPGAPAGPAVPGATSAGGGAPVAGAAGGTACGLVTEADATTAIGEPAGPGTPGGTAALSQCQFDQGALIIGMKADGRTFYDQQRAGLPAGRFTDLPGVGDGGFAAGGGNNMTLLFVKGNTVVSILLATVDGSALDRAVALAKVAADHL